MTALVAVALYLAASWIVPGPPTVFAAVLLALVAVAILAPLPWLLLGLRNRVERLRDRLEQRFLGHTRASVSATPLASDAWPEIFQLLREMADQLSAGSQADRGLPSSLENFAFGAATFRNVLANAARLGAETTVAVVASQHSDWLKLQGISRELGARHSEALRAVADQMKLVIAEADPKSPGGRLGRWHSLTRVAVSAPGMDTWAKNFEKALKSYRAIEEIDAAALRHVLRSGSGKLVIRLHSVGRSRGDLVLRTGPVTIVDSSGEAFEVEASQLDEFIESAVAEVAREHSSP